MIECALTDFQFPIVRGVGLKEDWESIRSLPIKSVKLILSFPQLECGAVMKKRCDRRIEESVSPWIQEVNGHEVLSTFHFSMNGEGVL